MKIGFYGHSNCACESAGSFINDIAASLNAEIVNIGVRQGSEERILFELKKTKEIDLAVIFHSYPHFLFLPGCDRDYAINNLEQLRMEYLFQMWNNEVNQHKKFKDKFKDTETFKSVILKYKGYLYDSDLHLNRYYGALIQIDQYLITKQIKTIHIPNKATPHWFKFSSGLIAPEINNIIARYATVNGKWFANGLTREGNILLADRLLKLVETMRFEPTSSIK